MVDEMDKIWIKFMKKHWQIFAMWIVAAIIAFIGAVYVFLWFVGEAQASALVPGLLGGWAMGHIITFLIHLIFWELLFIGIPVLIFIAANYGLWWNKLPEKERKEYKKEKLFGKSSKARDGGGAFSFVIFIVFCMKIWLDGNWGFPIAAWELDYLVSSCLWALFWVAVVVGIPLLLGVTWWIRHEMDK
jgi:hypothetical protein